jgi:hypothetical protein
MVNLLAMPVTADETVEREPPGLELLEYLGGLVRADDRWVDPLALREAEEREADVIAARALEVEADAEQP